jgi:hypothetical protein
MGQQHNKIIKRRRRKNYLARKNERLKAGVGRSAAKKAPAKKAAAKKAASKKAPVKKKAEAEAPEVTEVVETTTPETAAE